MEKCVKAETPYGVKTVKLIFNNAIENTVGGMWQNSTFTRGDVVTRRGVEWLRMLGVEVRLENCGRKS